MCTYRTRTIAILVYAPLLAAREEPLTDAEGAQIALMITARLVSSNRTVMGMVCRLSTRSAAKRRGCLVSYLMKFESSQSFDIP